MFGYIFLVVLVVYVGWLIIEEGYEIKEKLNVIKWQLYEIDTRLRNNTTDNPNNSNNQNQCQTQTKQQ